jgi:hypothetical protein
MSIHTLLQVHTMSTPVHSNWVTPCNIITTLKIHASYHRLMSSECITADNPPGLLTNYWSNTCVKLAVDSEIQIIRYFREPHLLPISHTSIKQYPSSDSINVSHTRILQETSAHPSIKRTLIVCFIWYPPKRRVPMRARAYVQIFPANSLCAWSGKEDYVAYIPHSHLLAPSVKARMLTLTYSVAILKPHR